MKTSPNRKMRDLLREKGVDVDLMWEVTGPQDTSIAWLSCYQISKDNRRRLIIVETFNEGRGWEVLITPSRRNEVSATVDSVMNLLESDI